MGLPINLNVKTFSPAMLAKAGNRSTFHLMITADIGKPEGNVGLSTDLVYVIDNSGSQGNSIPGTSDAKIDKVKEAAALALTRLGPNDRTAVIAFSSSAMTLLVLTACDATGKHRAENAIYDINTGGGTAFSTGLAQALSMLSQKTPGRNRIVLFLTDGENIESVDPTPLCVTMKEQGITLYIAGLGVHSSVEDKLKEMALANSAETNFRSLSTSQDILGFFADVQAAAASTVIRNARLAITPVEYAKVGNFELVTRAGQPNYVAADEPNKTEVKIGDMGTQEAFAFYLNLSLILPADIGPGRRSFGKIQLIGEDLTPGGTSGELRKGNIVVPFVTELNPNAQADPEVREIMGIAATAREMATFAKTGDRAALDRAAAESRKTKPHSRADVARLLETQIATITAAAGANPEAAKKAAGRATRSFSAAEKARLLGGVKN